jgi:hypothetical protein
MTQLSPRSRWSALALSLLMITASMVVADDADAAPRRRRSSKSAPAPKAPDVPSTSASAEGDTATRRGPARIEFDDRLVQGQTNKANAIYLFERRESALRSLLKKRTNFHAEMDEMLEDELVR